MDTIIESQNYWALLSTTPLQRALNRPLTSWFNQSWSQEIPGHLEALEKAQNLTAQTLGKLKNNSPVDTQTVIKEITALITSHTKPSHLSRNWLKYCALLTATYMLYYYGSQHQEELQQLVYDEDGNNKLTYFLSKHVYAPLQELFKKAFNKTELLDTTIFTQDPAAATASYVKRVDNFLQSALTSGHYNNIFAPEEIAAQQCNTGLNLGIKKVLINNIMIQDLSSPFYNMGRALVGREVFGAKSLLLRFDELNLQAAQAGHIAHETVQDLQLVKSMLMLTPACFLGWGGYKATTTALQSRYNNVVLTPLQRDIYNLENLLYQNYNTPFTDDYFLGMRIYWIAKLKTYLPKLYAPQKKLLNRILEQLLQETSIDNQLGIIRTILHINNF